MFKSAIIKKILQIGKNMIKNNEEALQQESSARRDFIFNSGMVALSGIVMRTPFQSMPR